MKFELRVVHTSAASELAVLLYREGLGGLSSTTTMSSSSWCSFESELCSIAFDSSDPSLGLPLIILEKDGSFVCSVSTEVQGRISTLVLLLLEEDTLGAISAKVCDGSVTLVDREDRLLSSPWDKKSGVCGGGEVTE